MVGERRQRPEATKKGIIGLQKGNLLRNAPSLAGQRVHREETAHTVSCLGVLLRYLRKALLLLLQAGHPQRQGYGNRWWTPKPAPANIHKTGSTKHDHQCGVPKRQPWHYC